MLKKILKYGVGGLLAAVIDLSLLRFFTEILGIYFIVSAVFSFSIAFFVGFVYQKYITFGCKKKKHLTQGFLFLIFQLFGLLINLFLLWILSDKFGFNYFYVAIFNKFIIFAWNFAMNNIFNFK